MVDSPPASPGLKQMAQHREAEAREKEQEALAKKLSDAAASKSGNINFL